MHLCDICKRQNFRTARGLSTHIRRIHNNRIGSRSPVDSGADLQDTGFTPYSYIHSPISQFASEDLASNILEMNGRGSSAILTHVSSTKNHPKPSGTPSRIPRSIPAYETRNWQPWAPFTSADDYQLSYAFWRHGSIKTKMSYFLEKGLDGDLSSFKDADEIRLKWRQTNALYGLPSISRNVTEYCTWRETHLPDVGTVLYRDVLDCIKHLLAHPPFRDELIYSPIQQFNVHGHRIYSDLHTADWWWTTQFHHPDGATIIPIICASDKAQLTNFSGDKSIWPLYMTIGNIPKHIRRERSKNAWICIGLLPTIPLDNVRPNLQ